MVHAHGQFLVLLSLSLSLVHRRSIALHLQRNYFGQLRRWSPSSIVQRFGHFGYLELLLNSFVCCPRAFCSTLLSSDCSHRLSGPPLHALSSSSHILLGSTRRQRPSSYTSSTLALSFDTSCSPAAPPSAVREPCDSTGERTRTGARWSSCSLRSSYRGCRIQWILMEMVTTTPLVSSLSPRAPSLDTRLTL